jgi:hypothetical protein
MTTCPNCGQAAQGAERFCANCGAELARPAGAVSAPAASVAPVTATAAAPAAGEPRGVAGWLLLYCVWIAIVAPLMQLRLVGYMREAAMQWSGNWMLMLSVGVTLFGVWTGVQLWRVDQLALAYLRVYFGLAAGMTLVGLFSFLTSVGSGMPGVIAMVVFGFVRSLVFLAVWVLYFRMSRRVRNTYGANLW